MKKEILFAHYPKATVKRYQNLLGAFSNLENAWLTNYGDLKTIGWKDELINDFLDWKKKIKEEKIIETLESENIYCITMDDKEYPPLLKTIYDPPFCLFVKGNLKNIGCPLAIVGPRKYSPYGKQIAQLFSSKLAKAGFTITSGLALGIDGIAHSSAIESNGLTVAVLGSGINKNNIYPTCHKELAEKIITSGGAVISEYAPGTEPTVYTFPKRNRIVSGMSLGTIVIEGAEKSGALITAQCALDEGREVFAIPQNITSPTSSGVNRLLKSGSYLVTDPDEIIEILGFKNHPNSDEFIPKLTDEQLILSALSSKPLHINTIIQQTGLQSDAVRSCLALLELSGKIKNLGSMMFVLYT